MGLLVFSFSGAISFSFSGAISFSFSGATSFLFQWGYFFSLFFSGIAAFTVMQCVTLCGSVSGLFV